jgi:hypothetical protein
MTLLNKFDSLDVIQQCNKHKLEKSHSADCFCHFGHAHEYGKPPPTKCGDSQLVVHVAELRGCV